MLGYPLARRVLPEITGQILTQPCILDTILLFGDYGPVWLFDSRKYWSGAFYVDVYSKLKGPGSEQSIIELCELNSRLCRILHASPETYGLSAFQRDCVSLCSGVIPADLPEVVRELGITGLVSILRVVTTRKYADVLKELYRANYKLYNLCARALSTENAVWAIRVLGE